MSELTFVDTCASTNDLARAHLAERSVSGWGVCARRQTAGRGRLGRSWSDLGGEQLFLSVALSGGAFRRVVAQLSLAAGVGVAEALAEQGVEGVLLKWPNDLIGSDGRKLGGILGEAFVSAGRVEGAIIGVGVNLAAPAAWPEGLEATSVSGLGHDIDREALARAVHRHVVARAGQLANGDSAGILDAWRARDATLGRGVRIVDGTQRGVAAGVDPSGALRVRDASGVVHLINSGEIVWDPDADGEA